MTDESMNNQPQVINQLRMLSDIGYSTARKLAWLKQVSRQTAIKS